MLLQKGVQTKQCGCRKKSRICGPGCECIGCTNTHQPEIQQPLQPLMDSSSEGSESDSTESESSSDCEIETEIICTDIDLEDTLSLV